MGEGGWGPFSTQMENVFKSRSASHSFVYVYSHSTPTLLICSVRLSHSISLALSLANSCWILSMAVRPKPIEAMLFIERKKVASYKHFAIHAVQGAWQHYMN